MKPAFVLPLAVMLAAPALAQDQSATPGQPGAPPVEGQEQQMRPQGQPDRVPLSIRPVTTREFIAFAASGDLLEIQSSRMALPGMTDPEFRALAQHIIDEHVAAAAELTRILASKGLEPPPATLLPPHADMLAMLQQAPPETMMRAYFNLQVQAHNDAIAQFSAYAQNGDDPDLRDFAERSLPKLQEHLESVMQLSPRLS